MKNCLKSCNNCIYSGNCYQKEHYTQMQSTCYDYLTVNEFRNSNITNRIEGAEVKEGDYITFVQFGGECFFNDGWEVIKQHGKLGIIWGNNKEFTPFEHFASRVIFTLGEKEQ